VRHRRRPAKLIRHAIFFAEATHLERIVGALVRKNLGGLGRQCCLGVLEATKSRRRAQSEALAAQSDKGMEYLCLFLDSPFWRHVDVMDVVGVDIWLAGGGDVKVAELLLD